jgi:hypothetical protein
MNTTEATIPDPFHPAAEFGARIVDAGPNCPPQLPQDEALLEQLCLVKVRHGSLSLGHRHMRDANGRRDYSQYRGNVVAHQGAVVELPYREALGLLVRFLPVAYEQTVEVTDATSAAGNPGIRILRNPLKNGKHDPGIELVDTPQNAPFVEDLKARLALLRLDAGTLNTRMLAPEVLS